GESGLGSGLVNTTQQVGGALGLAVLSAVAFARVDALAPDLALRAALTEGFQVAFYVGAGLAALGMVIALLVITGRTRRDTPSAPEADHAPTPHQPRTGHAQAQSSAPSNAASSANDPRVEQLPGQASVRLNGDERE